MKERIKDCPWRETKISFIHYPALAMSPPSTSRTKGEVLERESGWKNETERERERERETERARARAREREGERESVCVGVTHTHSLSLSTHTRTHA